MQAYHAMKKQEVLQEFEVNPDKGLSLKEAEKRLAQNGANELTERKKKSMLRRFLEQFKDFMILILLAAAAVSYGVSAWEGEADLADSAIILLIVVLNAILGVVQESKAERSIEALKQLSAPAARVLRDGKQIQIASRELVPGDVVYLQAGNLFRQISGCWKV